MSYIESVDSQVSFFYSMWGTDSYLGRDNWTFQEPRDIVKRLPKLFLNRSISFCQIRSLSAIELIVKSSTELGKYLDTHTLYVK